MPEAVIFHKWMSFLSAGGANLIGNRQYQKIKISGCFRKPVTWFGR